MRDVWTPTFLYQRVGAEPVPTTAFVVSSNPASDRPAGSGLVTGAPAPVWVGPRIVVERF